jgi:L-alanine-DL-glutamate epimerase-like enolase superfamily enzyme
VTAIDLDRIELHRAGGPIPRQGNARTTWDRRDTIVVALHDRAGRVGLGEAAPLPGFLDEAIDLDALRAGEASGPATAYALELAALDLRGQVEARPIAERLAPPESLRPARQVEVSALLGDPHGETALLHAKQLLDAGARTLKIKLATRTWREDVAAVRALRDLIGMDVELIGDANGAWSVVEARTALDQLAALRFAYVEQPVAPADLALLGPAPIAVWADESLADPARRAAVLDAPDIAGIVCKPTALGGLAPSMDLAIRAHARGKGVVVTHALEGPVAMAGCAALALSLGAIAPRAGIWPHEALGAFPDVGLPGYSAAVLRATDRPGLGFTEDERRLLLALPRVGDPR